MDNPLSSIWNNIAHKSKNPFLGTFALVWFARNWEAIYAVFAFEENRTIESKVEYISDHLRYNDFWQILGELGLNVLWSVGLLFITYILINATRYITNIFENRVTPRVNELSAPKRIVSSEMYQEELKKVTELEKRLEQERDEKLKARSEVESLESKVQELISTSIIGNSGLGSNSQESTSTQSTKKELEELSKQLESKLDLIYKNFGNEDIDYVLSRSLNGSSINVDDYNDEIAELIKGGFIELKESQSSSYNIYKPTKSGLFFLQTSWNMA
ncbi:hypothetical protein [Marinoscillum sp.]|uniref:hypothetical protein n=1 Tax=Marinoscillum sp. TaxID=2024838 RepID=UPI003BA896FC